MTFAADKEEASLVYCGNLESDKKTEKRLRHSNGAEMKEMQKVEKQES